LVFLEELTTGLDPQVRLAIWDVIRDIRDRGTTVFLTTDFMAEAENLCDRVAIVDHGRIDAVDTVGNLISSIGEEHSLNFMLDGPPPLERLEADPAVSRVERSGGYVIVYGTHAQFPHGVLGALSEVGL